jgi:Fe-S-cluster-containing dehydrogenase component/formate-dependent nitrite reductase membrane component NrfD
MNYGFVIDNRSCIGCHACSTACKSENQVPLGVYRTWVKYTETGTFPDTQRHFQVTRCNHCANPPCVRICPTGAMYQRDDGIVEFDSSACIGCKACLQACPYDAIHIDPASGTAAKCHYCSHRVELGLEPACVVVCPTHAIIAGDLDDPASEISRVVARQQVSVRKPEQGTAPKLFYIDGAAVNLVPTATERTPETFSFADVVDLHGARATSSPTGPSRPRRKLPVVASGGRTADGTALRAGQPQGLPVAGPIQLGGRNAAHMVQTGYNAQHRVPWHWPVPAYLVTKSIAAGAFLVLAAALGLGVTAFDARVAIVTGAIAVALMTATTALLVYDLEKPMRFLYILLRPQWRSWLARGAVFLIGFTTVAALFVAAELAAWLGLVPADLVASVRPVLLWAGVPLAIGTAIYTAFLFGQAEGRDLWQSPLLPLHLLVQAVAMGGAALLVVGAFLPLGDGLATFARYTFGGALAVDLAVTLLGELGMPHSSEVAARAAHEISHGRYRGLYWIGSVVVGHLAPLALVVAGGPAVLAIAGLAAVAGLYCYEHAFVMAPQEIPNS